MESIGLIEGTQARKVQGLVVQDGVDCVKTQSCSVAARNNCMIQRLVEENLFWRNDCIHPVLKHGPRSATFKRGLWWKTKEPVAKAKGYEGKRERERRKSFDFFFGRQYRRSQFLMMKESVRV